MTNTTSEGEDLDPVVRAALTELRAFTYRRRRIYNLHLERREKNLTDRGARAGAIHIFKHLKYHGYSFPPGDVRAWAVANHWRPKDAQELGDYAEGILEGKRYHTAPDPFGKWAIERWQSVRARRFHSHRTCPRSLPGRWAIVVPVIRTIYMEDDLRGPSCDVLLLR